MSAPNIREYQPEDLGDLLASWENATRLAHPFFTEEFIATERENIPNLYLPNAQTWVAEQEGRVVGFIALLGDEIGALFVQPELHGKGIGRALTDHARSLTERLEVEVFEENPLGRRFYALCGFKPLSESIHEPTGHKLLRLRLG